MAQPFDEQPLFRTGCMTIDVAVGRANPDTGEARSHGAACALTPCHVAPGALGQPGGRVGNGNGAMPGVAADAGRGAARAGGGGGGGEGLRGGNGAGPGGHTVVSPVTPTT